MEPLKLEIKLNKEDVLKILNEGEVEIKGLTLAGEMDLVIVVKRA